MLPELSPPARSPAPFDRLRTWLRPFDMLRASKVRTNGNMGRCLYCGSFFARLGQKTTHKGSNLTDKRKRSCITIVYNKRDNSMNKLERWYRIALPRAVMDGDMPCSCSKIASFAS